MDLIKAEFTDSSYTELWRHSIACQTAGCNYGISTSAIDVNTNSLWHTLAFDDKILFINQDISTGAQVGSRYMLSSSQTSWTGSMSTAFSNNIAYFNFYWSNLHNLVSFNTTSFEIISSVVANGTALRVRDIQAYGDNLYVFGITVGSSGNDVALFTRVHFSNLERIETTSNSSVLLSEITDTTYELVNTSTVTGLSVVTQAYSDGGLPSDVTNINITVSSDSIQSDVSDTYLDTVNISSIISGHNHSEVIQMPCTIDGTTAITYSLVQNGNESVPDFVSYDDASFTLSIVQPDVTSDTNYTFKISANTSTETHERVVYLPIAFCQVEYCSLWSESSATSWNQCEDGFELNNDKTQCDWVYTTEVNQTSYSYATQGIASLGVLSSLASSATSKSSPQGAWAMINQLQLLIMMPLIIDNFNEEVKNYVLGMDMALLSFDFIPAK